MAITKNKNGTYRVEVYYPKEVQEITGVKGRYKKTFKTLKEAKEDEKKILEKIQRVIQEKNSRALEIKGNIKFQKFYEETWLDMYKTGSTGRTRQIPSSVTIQNTEDIFRIHILPMFGDYSIKWLNENKEFVLRQLTSLSQTYANIKVVKGYVNQVFEMAELLDYIEYNRIEKVIRYVSAPKKQKLKEERELVGESMTARELIEWLDVVNKEYDEGILIMQDYVLFMLTLNIGDRKSESYALQWKHIDFENGYILLTQNLSKVGKLKSTKGKKNTKIAIPLFLIELLKEWKEYQKIELKQIDIKQTKEQFLFTYVNGKGEINVPVHIDYLNYRLNSIRRRNPDLVKLNPHKLRHTYSTLAREGGASMSEISEALTHSDTKITETYVNTPNVVKLSMYEKFEGRLNEERRK
ncbi:tyrosine-type recombinase/integrase [Enterococcus sp. G203Y]|uniref:tyrosine-type recombinase/integrase n=1 Tax=Enterococcus TaxID=1350 RepID=UPI000CF02CB0|nr:site-specific integrase [Enterococcus faecalis]PQD15541.1 site-specific integrase [Enterococcus faecalis]